MPSNYSGKTIFNNIIADDFNTAPSDKNLNSFEQRLLTCTATVFLPQKAKEWCLKNSFIISNTSYTLGQKYDQKSSKLQSHLSPFGQSDRSKNRHVKVPHSLFWWISSSGRLGDSSLCLKSSHIHSSLPVLGTQDVGFALHCLIPFVVLSLVAVCSLFHISISIFTSGLCLTASQWLFLLFQIFTELWLDSQFFHFLLI